MAGAWRKVRSGRAAALILLFATLASIGLPPAAATPNSIAAFCQDNPNVDFPDCSRDLPAEVAASGATDWRCMDGRVYVCFGGASGSACHRMDASRTPSDEIKATCEGNPGQDFVAIAVIANSASTWRCRGRTPEIIATVPLDGRGFMKGTWFPLFDAEGKIDETIEFGADPR